MKIKIPKSKSLKKQCDDLWAYAIKLRAGFKSELSGEAGRRAGGNIVLASHHIFGKSNNRLKYDLKNGICLNNHTEHIWGVHNKNNPALAYEIHEKILKHIGKETEKYLQELRQFKGKTDLKLTKIYLQEEIKKMETK